ncbi:MAG TPA: heme o synthase [Candidatus Limnocylindria bacterium]|nr:heme o synthase [Candidatus Limnocylindria bacterium]
MALAWPGIAAACPVCFAADPELVRWYLLSTYFLSLLPFGIVGGVAGTAYLLARSAAAPEKDAAAAPALDLAAVGQRLLDYVMLCKPRVVLMVLLTMLAGYYLGAGSSWSATAVLHALVGTGLAAAGTMALNQYLERERDAHMARTADRPLPAGRLRPLEGLAVGLALLIAGLGVLYVETTPLAAAVTAVIAATYLLLYTPLKGVTPLCSLVGAVPGALPPVVGWAVARGTIGPEAVVLFGIMFLWQIPHTLAISALYRDDYARAGIRVLPTVDVDGPSTALYAIGHCLALLPVALMPTVFGFAGPVYFVAALVLGLMFLWAAVGLMRAGTLAAARRLMVTSLVYLPVLLVVLALDHVPPR